VYGTAKRSMVRLTLVWDS